MRVNENSPLLIDRENWSQDIRIGHQSPQPRLVQLDLSISNDPSPLMRKVNPQIASLDDVNFQWPSFEGFDKEMNAGRVQVLLSFLEFDIEDAASHIERVSRHTIEPMFLGELRKRLADLNRLHGEISSNFEEIMRMKLSREESRVVHELFEQHVYSYWPAKRSYERFVGEADGTKKPLRIDFRQFRPENVTLDLIAQPACRKFIASPLRSRVKRPATILPEVLPKDILLASLTVNGVNSSISGSDAFLTEPSHPLQAESSSSALTSLVSETGNMRLTEALFQPCQAVSLSELAIKTKSSSLVLEKGSTNASPSDARLPASSTKHFANASLEVTRFEMFSSPFVQRSVSENPLPLILHSPLQDQSTFSVFNPDFREIGAATSERESISVPPVRAVIQTSNFKPNPSPLLARFRASSSRAVQQFANVNPTWSQFHMHMLPPFRPANKNPEMISFHLQTSFFSSLRLGSANASSSKARFPTTSGKHCANASSLLARFRMFSSQHVQRPASASLAQLRLCMHQARTQLMSQPFNVSFEAVQFISCASLLPLLLSTSTSFNITELQILIVQEEAVMSEVRKYVLSVHDRPWKFTRDSQEICSAEMNHDAHLKLCHIEDVRWYRFKKRMKNIDFNAAHENLIVTDSTISSRPSNFDSTVMLAALLLPATNALLFVACKFSDRCSEAATNVSSFSINDSNFFKSFQQRNCLYRKTQESGKNCEFGSREWFKALDKSSFELEVITATNAVAKTICIKWKTVIDSASDCSVVQFCIEASSNKANLMSQVPCIFNLRKFVCSERITASFEINKTTNVQAIWSFCEFRISSQQQKSIACFQMFVFASIFKLVLKIIDAFSGIVDIIWRIKLSFTLFLRSENQTVKNFVSCTESIITEAEKLKSVRLISRRQLLELLLIAFLEQPKLFRSNYLNAFSKFGSTNSVHSTNFWFSLKTIVKHGLKKPPCIKHLAIRLVISNPRARPSVFRDGIISNMFSTI